MEEIKSDIKDLKLALKENTELTRTLISLLEENTRITGFLRTELEENTELNRKLLVMLGQNSEHTKFLYDTKKVDLTPGQMTKSFGLQVAANGIGNILFPSQ